MLVGALFVDKVFRRPVTWAPATVFVAVGLAVDDEAVLLDRVPDSHLLAAAIVVVLAGLGAVQVAERSLDGALVGVVASAAAVFVAVPEADPAAASAGLIGGFAVARLLRLRIAPAVLAAAVAALMWAALVGAVGRTFPLTGGVLSLGLALTWPAGRLIRSMVRMERGVPFGWWLLGVHGVLAVGGARLVGAADAPTWAVAGALAAFSLGMSVAVDD